MISFAKRHSYALYIFFLFCLLCTDIGNLDALRQGTEGFYLQVSKEMFQAGNYLTPLYSGEPHWSKPPFHFLAPFPLYSFLGAGPSPARLSVLILCFILIFLIGRSHKLIEKSSDSRVFLLLASSFFIIKYSRIYMMDASLALLSVLGPLFFFRGLLQKRIFSRPFLWAIFFSALAINIKGPVSLVMNTVPTFIYILFRYTKDKKALRKYLIKFSLWAILSAVLGSLWFLVMASKFGQQFIDYFFIRENLGKFTAKPYPLRHLFQGLFIYMFPLSPFFLFSLWKKKKGLFTGFKSPNYRSFLILQFSFSFALWMIPNQRSHHYALPAIPWAILWLSSSWPKDGFSRGQLNILKTIFFIPLIILVSALCLIFFFSDFLNQYSVGLLLLAQLFLLISIVLLFKMHSGPGRSDLRFLGSFTLSSAFILVFILPLFYLPTVPSKIISLVGDQKVFCNYRKPYFISASFNRDVPHIDERAINKDLRKAPKALFLSREVIIRKWVNLPYQELARWKVWQRNNGLEDFYKAWQSKSLKGLQEDFILIKINSKKAKK